MIKIIFSFIAILLFHGCAITPIYEDIPKTEKDFQLSQDEILNKFSAISNHHIENLGDSNKSIPLYTDIVKDWGEPISKKKEWLNHIWNYVNLGSIGYTAFGSFDALWLIFEGAMISVNPYPPETYTWHKGDYKIDATFYNRPNQDKKYFAYWKWQKKENLALTNILPTTPDKNFYFRLGFSTGGEKVIKTKNSTIDYYPIGRGITLQLGYSYNIFSDNSSRIKFAAGIKDSGLLDLQSGAKLIEYPVDAIYSVKTDMFPLYLGVGIGYKINPTIHNYSDDIDKLQLDNAVSFILELESKLWFNYDSLIRYEFLNYTKDNIKEIRGNNFSIFFNTYF